MNHSVVGALLRGCADNQEAMLQVQMAGMGILHNLESTGFHLKGDPAMPLPPEFHNKWGVGTVKSFNTILRGAAAVRQADIIGMIVYANRLGMEFGVKDGVENMFQQKAA